VNQQVVNHHPPSASHYSSEDSTLDVDPNVAIAQEDDPLEQSSREVDSVDSLDIVPSDNHD